jgi:hypothetical protein
MQRALITAVAIVFLPVCWVSADDTQADWSGGGGVPGPVTDWGDRFDTASGISWAALPGQIALASSALASPVEHLINDTYVGAIGVGVGDIDGDGDLDVVGTAQTSGIVNWWRNDGGDPPTWTEYEIGTPPGAAGVDVADIDGDGRPDVILSLVAPRNKIVWKQNLGGDPIAWGTQTIQSPWRDAWEISTGDVNADGNLDVMCTHWSDSDVAWWENDGGDPITWTHHLVDGGLAGAHSVRGADLDGDGDMDLAAACGVGNKIVIYWSDGADSITWTRQDIESGFTGARSVWIDDIDQDGDLDVAGICWTSDVAWWSNDGGDPVVWTKQTISTTANGGHALCIADLNGDSRPDILAACNEADKIVWWQNGGGAPIAWTEHILSNTFTGAISVRAGDLDGDGDLDPVGVCWGGDEFAWWEATKFDSGGGLTGSILDSGAGESLGVIDWTSAEPPGTSLRFQVRSSNDSGDLGTWSGDITVPGCLPAVLDRYVQYRVFLETADADKSPILRDITFSSELAGLEPSVPDLAVSHLAAHPNPFGPEVTISFRLKTDETVRLRAFDVEGRRVCEIADRRLQAGWHRFAWNGTDANGNLLGPGIYWLCLETPGSRASREVVLLR